MATQTIKQFSNLDNSTLSQVKGGIGKEELILGAFCYLTGPIPCLYGFGFYNGYKDAERRH